MHSRFNNQHINRNVLFNFIYSYIPVILLVCVVQTFFVFTILQNLEKNAINVWYLSPEKFKEVLKKMKEISDKLPKEAWGRKIIMIDNWNEWDEGHFVAPSHKFGYKYLQAIREALTECNNLPDYITPHDQGFEGYNKSWKTPDFKEICNKNINLGK